MVSAGLCCVLWAAAPPASAARLGLALVGKLGVAAAWAVLFMYAAGGHRCCVLSALWTLACAQVCVEAVLRFAWRVATKVVPYLAYRTVKRAGHQGRHYYVITVNANTFLAMLLAPELFPTPVRSFTTGVVAAVGRVGGAVSPFLLGAGGLAATFVAMGVANMAAGLLVLLLPETMGACVGACRTGRPGPGTGGAHGSAEGSRRPAGLCDVGGCCCCCC